MSYILDALRRAEAERERGSVPGLHAQAAATPGAPPTHGATHGRGGGWAVPAIVALGVAVAVLGWRQWTADAPVAAVVPAPTPAPPRAVEPVAPAPAPVQRLVLPRAPEVLSRDAVPPLAARKRAGVPASSAAAASAPAVAAPKISTLAELPDDVRREVPAVAIGGSIYSADPASRFVMVNGQIFHEGDTIAPGLRLEQIRLKSAVLSFKGYRYSTAF